MASRFRKAVSSTLAFAMIYGSWPSQQAIAGACGAGVSGGSGPPSISATEVSTTQALEVLRRRKDEQQQPVVLASLSQQPPAAAQAAPPPAPPPAQQAAPAPKAQASAAPAGQGGAPGAASPAAKKLVKKAAPKTVAKAEPVKKTPAKEKTVVATAEPAAPAPVYRGGSLKDDYVDARPAPVHGVWVQGYYDYEQIKGWTLLGADNPGSLKSKQDTAGVIGGFDRKVASRGDATWIVGVLGGYENSKTTYNNQNFHEVPADFATYRRINAHDTTEGGSVGLYTVLSSPTWSFDGLLKFDILSYDQRDQFIQTNCVPPNGGPFERQNTSDMFNVVVAANVARRYMHTATSWFEPTVGFRYTHTDYSNLRQFGNAPGGGPDLPFGLTDGDVLRLQGGLRYGMAHILSADRVLITTIGGFLYSDVLISGISKDYQDVIEGKVRVMGQLTAALAEANGMTYLLQGEVRGGDNLFGVGVKGGVRYEW